MSIRRPGRSGCRFVPRASIRWIGRSARATWPAASRWTDPDTSGWTRPAWSTRSARGSPMCAVGDDVFGLGSDYQRRVRGPAVLRQEAGVGGLGRRRGGGCCGRDQHSCVGSCRGDEGQHSVHRWRCGRRRRCRGADRDCPRRHGHRLGGSGKPGLSPRDRRHPGAVRRRCDRSGAGDLSGRGGRSVRCRGQDAGGGPDQPGAGAVAGRHHRELRCRRVRRPADDRPFPGGERRRWRRLPLCWSRTSW